MPFVEKAVFIWCYWDIFSGDVELIADALVEAGFEAAYVHTSNGVAEASYNGRINCTPELVAALKRHSLVVYGWGAPYGNPAKEATIAAQQTRRYGLAGYIFDGESLWDSQPNAVDNTRVLLQEYKAMCPGTPAAWCWWPLHHKPSNPNAIYHPVAVLNEAMKHADVGMPMAYWEGSTATAADSYLTAVWAQWREVTNKPIVVAGRAWNDKDGTASRAAVEAFVNRARALCAHGLSFWDMQHAVRLPETWQALKDIQWTTGAKPGEEPTMWETNSLLISLYNDKLEEPTQAVDFAALASAGVEGFVIPMGGCSDGYQFVFNSSYRSNLIAARKTGRMVIGICKFNPFVDGMDYPHSPAFMEFMRQSVGSDYIPDAFVLSHEVGMRMEGTASKVITPTNLGNSIAYASENLWNKYKRPVLEYTGGWYLPAAYDKAQKTNILIDWLSRNRDRFPLVMAYWSWSPGLKSASFATAKVAAAAVPVLPGNEEAAHLCAGNAVWHAWEAGQMRLSNLSSAVRLWIWNGTAAEMYPYLLRQYPGVYQPAQTEDPGTGDPGTGDPQPVDMREVLNVLLRLKADLAALSAQQQQTEAAVVALGLGLEQAAGDIRAVRGKFETIFK